MKILHVLSNWKWTERAEPAADLALAEQKLGKDVVFACGRSPAGIEEDVAYHAEKKGIKRVVRLDLPKHLNVFSIYRDISCLRNFITEFKPQVINCHMPNAHILGGLARGRKKQPIIIRSCYDPDGLPKSIRSAFLVRNSTDGLIMISNKAVEKVKREFGLSLDTVQAIEPGVDTERFSKAGETGGREEFGFKKDQFVIGMVSRIRKERRIDVALDAVRLLAKEYPHVRLLVVGRGGGNAERNIVTKPAFDMGISDRVILAGYCADERLVAAYGAMDVLVYPVPGTDKSCRTVREAMSAGVPVIASGIGFPAELIEDRVSGCIMDLSSESLAGIIRQLILDQEKLRQMGGNAFKSAKQRFDPLLRAEKVLEFYGKIINNA
ncbi:glycosyltransferase family 4 protein [Verrucomicrobiota bacterium]